ncbi:hypothetical protein HKD37_18G051374 [Glycine soja]
MFFVNMTSGGVDPPRPLSHDSIGKGTFAKKRRCMVRLLPPRDSLTSSTPFLSSMSIPVRPPNVAPTPSPPLTKARPSLSHVNAHGPSLVPISTPSPSSVDARGPSPIPTSTPSPSLLVGNMPVDENAVNLAMKDLPLNNHPMVMLINGAFHPSKVATKTVTLSIRQQFGQPWPTRGVIPKEHKELFSSRKLVWRPEEENEIKKLLTQKLLIDFMRCLGMPKMKIKGHIGLKIVFGTIYYHIGMHLSIIPSVHMQKKIGHLKRVGVCTQSEEFGRFVYVDEVFQQTHLRKDTDQFVDDRSRRTHEDFEAGLSQARSNVASSVDPAEEQRLRSRCWVTAVGPKCKGHLYSTGDLAYTYKCGNDSFIQHTQGSSIVLQFLPPEVWNIIHQQQQPHQQHQDQQQDQADEQQTDDQ